MSPSPPLLTLAAISKAYGPVTVLRDVNLALARGEVHALVGENGAGKSTLARILAGHTRPDTGDMTFRGAPFAPRQRSEAAASGIRMVMQELNLLPTLTVGENIFLENLPHRLGWIDRARLRHQTREALARVGLAELDPDELVGRLGVGRQQLVEIAAGLSQRCELLILDEPTAALTAPEVDRLAAQIAALRAAGTTILYISHRLEEIRRLADRVTVLREGRIVATRPVAAWSLDELVSAMVGRPLDAVVARARPTPGPVALRVTGLRRGTAVRDVSFEVRRGEILGLAGLMGSGRTETVRAIFGADPRDAGDIQLGPDAAPVAIRSPRDAVRAGVALLTEDRKDQGLLLALPIRTNLTLPSLHRVRAAGGWIRRRREYDQAAHWIRALGVRCRDADQPVGELSGGNQQKVVLAKWLLRDCAVLLVDEPTRGIDVGARQEIHARLRELAATGKAIVVVSSDLPELLALADRIAVMSAGRLVATLDRAEATEKRIMDAALSGYTTAVRNPAA